MKKLLKSVLLASLVLANAPHESFADLSAPFSLETAAVLPKGVRNPRFVNLFVFADSKFDPSGNAKPLADPLSQPVTWAKLVRDLEENKRANFMAIVKANRLEDTYPGSTTGDIQTYANVKVPVLAMGLTDRFTLAVAVPIMKVDANVETGFVASNQTGIGADGNPVTLAQALERANEEVAADAIWKLNHAVDQKMINNDYDLIRSKTVEGVGDVNVVAKYQIRSDALSASAIKATFTLPTGTAPNDRAALDIPTGDGRYKVGLMGIYDQRLAGISSNLKWNTYGGYTALLPTSLYRRVPYMNQPDPTRVDAISKDREFLKKKMGHNLSMGTSLDYYFSPIGLVVGSGYSYQFTTKTSYQPGQYEAERYTLLEAVQPLQAMHAFTATAGFSTVDWYKNKKFVYPFQVNVAYSHPLAGRNVSANDLVAGELILFF